MPKDEAIRPFRKLHKEYCVRDGSLLAVVVESKCRRVNFVLSLKRAGSKGLVCSVLQNLSSFYKNS